MKSPLSFRCLPSHHIFTTSALCTLALSTSAVAQKNDDPQAVGVVTVTAEALKVDTPSEETPKSLSILSEQDLTRLAPSKIDEALRYSAGVRSQPYGSDNDTDWFRVRGFEAASYLDGNRLFRDGYYTWLLEPYGLERIEIIKGPSAIEFGEMPPGGIINAIQKKPSLEPLKEIRFELGSDNHRSVSFDASNSLSENKWFRVTGLARGADGALDDTQTDRLYLAPSLEIELSERTNLTLLATLLQDDGTPTNPFFPAAGTIIDTPFGKLSPSTNLGEPGYDDYERTQASIGYQLEHEYNDIWRWSQNLNYGYNDLLLRSVYAFPNADPEATSLFRGVVFRDGSNQSLTFDNNALGAWSSHQLQHTLLLGLDLQHHVTDGDEQDNFSFSSINPWRPEYGNFTPLDETDNIDREIKKTQASVYSKYQLKAQEKWHGIVGARYDWVDTENRSDTRNQDKSRDDEQLSVNAGLMYLGESGFSPYVSYGQSFEVLSTIDPSTGELYRPLEGEQFELGIKYAPQSFNGFVNLAWFDITQKNALVTNPTTFVATQTGEVTSRGIELEFRRQLNDDLSMALNYTYTDAQTDNTGGQGKKQAGLIPKEMASVQLGYDASSLGALGLELGAGVRYAGESKDNPASSDRTVPSATLFDAYAHYQLSPRWSFQLNVNNLSDKQHVSACDYYCYYGPSRSVLFTSKYRW